MSEEPATKKQKMPLKICTHSGSFHADESLAVYMLKTLSEFKDAELVRSRKPEDWEAADIVVDVSGKYDGKKHFDHHQREFTDTFNETYKTKLSSAGLVYKHYGKQIIAENVGLDLTENSKEIEFLYDRVYRDFIEAVDANDNGVNKYDNQDDLRPNFRDKNFSLAGVVSNLNPSWDSDPTDADFDRNFEKASEIMGFAFKNFLLYMGKSFLPAKQYVERAFESRFDADASGHIIKLEKFVPWKEHLYAIEKENNAVGEVLYVLFPDSSQNWRIASVPVTASSFDSRKKLPEPWRGVRDDELSALTGVPDCVFIHAAGFIGGAKTESSVLALAKKAL